MRRELLSKEIVETDIFMNLSQMAKLYYLYLCIYADDDGLYDKPYTLLESLKCQIEVIKELENVRFIFMLDNGVYVNPNHLKKSRSNGFLELKEDCNIAKLVENKAIEHSDCEECLENYVFKLRDKEHEFFVGLTTILSCLLFAESEGAIPRINDEWWIAINNVYEY